MVQFRFCLLLAALCACCDLGLSEFVTTPKVITIPVPHSDPANSAPAKENVAAPSTSTEPAPTKTDVTPALPSTKTPPIPDTNTNTNNKDTNTTTSSTTTTTTTTSTTPAPHPVTTPAPEPIPPPQQGNWTYVNETNNVVCIVVEFAARLDVTYPKTVDGKPELGNVTFNVPRDATPIAGSCDETQQFITISWPAGSSNISNTMTITYFKNETTKTYGLESLNFTLSPDMFVNASSKAAMVLSHGAEWQTPLATSYRCWSPTRMSLGGDSSASVAYLTLSQLREEAFRNVNGTGFSTPRDCSSGDVPDAVPIAVGCALGGLVLVVLIAYLVGRRRSAARGYLSM